MMPAVNRLRDACVVLLLLWASAASAQHGMPKALRPLHARLAEADVVALGTVERVETGRIDVVDAFALRGEPGDRFRLKRAPSRPFGLAPGERALLLLRGARTPYVVVDEPREILKLASAEQEQRWRAALGELLASEGGEAQRDVYLAWIDGPDEELRGAAIQALGDRSQALPVTADLARERARIALDPARLPAVRRASVNIACQNPAGTATLLAGIGAPGVDPGVVQLGLALAVMQRAEGLTPALVATLRSTDPEVVAAALPAATLSARGPAVRAELERIAAQGATEELRASAARALGRSR